ncbi:DUF3237 domain-containing protein [Caballeronia mineralivorans]|jgi:hypothetical protein|uniref:DUF3237 domain-containing protein n=1 Tax=Caballeronia mineralivorans TaxID=2010198 RepID=UPI002AFFF64B|nr:DUF3237 domain-containing protein [Caballeronia mineralivorans]MEA3102835.1 hypothetical protein [Caballeronia mineralivorans]
MSTPIFNELPASLQSVQTRPLFVVRLDVKPIVVVGDTPGPFRRVGIVPSGTFAGERLSGKVLDGGSDWQVVRSDGSTTLDVRLILQTDDGTHITMAYRGIRHGAADVIQRLEKGEEVDPANYYFRINPIFEAPSGKYEWLNRVIAVGAGHRFAYGPVYSVFEVL